MEAGLNARQQVLIPPIMSSVEALPVFRMVSNEAALAIDAHDIGLRRKSIPDVGYIANVDGCAVHAVDRQIVESATVSGLLLVDAVLELSDLECAGGEDHVLHAIALTTSIGESPSTAGRRFQIHLHLALLTAVRKGNAAPGIVTS